ncbi:MAG TPA: exosome complex RNA-binding protein Rrp4 [archaeon]|nr:exosome complex RNA-binding protein Rrp4 [archaeon]
MDEETREREAREPSIEKEIKEVMKEYPDLAKEALKEVVLPGEFLGDKKGRKIGHGAYFEGEKVFSKYLGIPRIDEFEINVMPLSGVYIPETDDRIIGVINSVEVSGWFVDINSPYQAFLPVSEGVEEFVDQRTDISRFFDINDIINCKVSRVTKSKTVQVSMNDYSAKKLYGGVIIKVTPTKIPRIIGKGGSMIQTIKQATKCDIVVGQNGVIWIRGDIKAKAIEAILTIEKESHMLGLTEKIQKMLGEGV